MSKLRYGPRYNNPIASAKYEYDERIDRDMRDDQRRIAAGLQHMPKYKKELMYYKLGTNNAKKVKAKAQPIKDERLEAERRMLEAMRHVVSTLEFHLEELHRTRKLGNDQCLVNQQGIHNALVLLRTKCGVKFEPNEYDHRVELDRGHLPRDERLEQVRFDRKEQRLARLRNMRGMAERFISKHRPQEN